MARVVGLVSALAVVALCGLGCEVDCSICCTERELATGDTWKYCWTVTEIDKDYCEDCSLPEVKAEEQASDSYYRYTCECEEL